MENTKEFLIPNGFYHIYNRANGNERLFLNDNNFRYFLKKYWEYILPIADTYAYCLMPNHFHFLVEIKEHDEIIEEMKKRNKESFEEHKINEKSESHISQENISKFLSLQFSHLFNGYTQAFNKQNNRKGGLFMPSFKRKRIKDENYLKTTILYIHQNPVEAGIAETVSDWKYSSYNPILNNEDPNLNRRLTISWFDDLDNFKFCH